MRLDEQRRSAERALLGEFEPGSMPSGARPGGMGRAGPGRAGADRGGPEGGYLFCDRARLDKMRRSLSERKLSLQQQLTLELGE